MKKVVIRKLSLEDCLGSHKLKRKIMLSTTKRLNRASIVNSYYDLLVSDFDLLVEKVRKNYGKSLTEPEILTLSASLFNSQKLLDGFEDLRTAVVEKDITVKVVTPQEG